MAPRRTQLSVKHLTIDCANPRELGDWWARLLDADVEHASDDYVVISRRPESDIALGFIQVPEPKTVKNRLHLDLAVNGSWQEAIHRVRVLGATQIAHHREHGQEWIVFADPEGNEFCV